MKLEIVSGGLKETYQIPDQLGRELWKQLQEAKKSGNPKRDILLAFEAGQGLVINLAQIGYIYLQAQGSEETISQTESATEDLDLE